MQNPFTHHARQGQGLVDRDGPHGDGVAEVGGGEAELLAIIDDRVQRHEPGVRGVGRVVWISSSQRKGHARHQLLYAQAQMFLMDERDLHGILAMHLLAFAYRSGPSCWQSAQPVSSPMSSDSMGQRCAASALEVETLCVCVCAVGGVCVCVCG